MSDEGGSWSLSTRMRTEKDRIIDRWMLTFPVIKKQVFDKLQMSHETWQCRIFPSSHKDFSTTEIGVVFFPSHKSALSA